MMSGMCEKGGDILFQLMHVFSSRGRQTNLPIGVVDNEQVFQALYRPPQNQADSMSHNSVSCELLWNLVLC